MAIGTKKSEDNLPVVIGCTLVVFGVLLGSASGVPSQKLHEAWWKNACDYHRSTTTQFPTRHSRSAQETQLRTFIKKTEFFVKDFKSIYPKLQDPQFKSPLKWLQIKKMQRELSTTKGTFYQAFHTTLQKFAIFMNHLRNMKIQTPIKFPEKNRTTIYDNAMNQLKLVLCEFDDLLYKRKLEPKYLSSIKEIRSLKSPLPKSADYSVVQIMDVTFFQKMGKFLRRSQRDLRRALRSDRKHRRKGPKAFRKKHGQV